jgi:acyl-CoA thioesterase
VRAGPPLPSPAVTSRFAGDTAVQPLGDGRFAARIDPGWRIHNPNGGYVAAIVLRAITTAVDDPWRRPRSFTVHFLRPPTDGEVEVAVTLERVGVTVTAASARLLQHGRLLALALASLGTDRDGPTYERPTAPDVPAPDDCAALPPSPNPMPFRDHFDSRHCLGSPPFAGGGEALTGGWQRLTDPEPTDAHVLALLADAWPPAVFGVADLPRGGVPTIDLTVHFRQAPVSEDPWLLVRFSTRLAAEGYLEEDGEIWDRDGRLLAQSRQLAVITG